MLPRTTAKRYCALIHALVLLTLVAAVPAHLSANTVSIEPLLDQAIALRYDEPEQAIELLSAELGMPNTRLTSEQRFEIADLAARIARDRGLLKQAYNFSGRMLELSEQTAEPVLQGRALHMQGTILAEQGDISSAIEYFHRARQILKNTSATESLILAINALGVAHNFLEDYPRSREYYEEALPYAREVGNQSLELSILSNLAVIEADLTSPVVSIDLHKQALVLARELERTPQIANQLANLCKQYTLIDQLEAAESACQEALPIAESLEHPRLLAGTLMTYGDLRIRQESIPAGLSFYERALPIVQDSLPFVEIELLGKKAQAHEQQGNFAQALTHLRRSQTLREEIIDAERNEAIEELEVQYQVEQQAREVNLLRLETELQAAELRQSQSLLITSLIALLFVFVIVLFIWHNYRRKSKLQRDLAVRNNELNQAIEQVSHLASRDALTGLLNRRSFKQAAEQENAERLRNKTPLTLVVADVDKFKLINDVHGHSVGDQVLRIIAHRIQNSLREVDLACRWGGEEFLLMLPNTSAEAARPIIQRLRDELAEHPVETLAGKLPITLTFGIAEVTTGIKDAIHAADQAMYAGKRSGPNRVVVSNLISFVSSQAS